MNKEIVSKVNKSILYAVRIVLIITAIIMLVQQQYYNVKILGITFVITFYAWIIKKILKIEINDILQSCITIFIFSAQYLGTVMDWYGVFFWWDTALHTLSGGLFFVIGVFLLEQMNQEIFKAKKNIFLVILFGVCFSLSIGVIWEIIEFSIDSLLGANMQRTVGEVGKNAIMDTMIDLIVATLGSLIVAIGYGIYKKIKTKE